MFYIRGGLDATGPGDYNTAVEELTAKGFGG